jgi:hypothetical protein
VLPDPNLHARDALFHLAVLERLIVLFLSYWRELTNDIFLCHLE